MYRIKDNRALVHGSIVARVVRFDCVNLLFNVVLDHFDSLNDDVLEQSLSLF